MGFPAGTGVCHTFINNTDEEVRLLVVGEANKNITVSTIRSIRCMPRRAKTAGSTIRLSFWAARWKTWAKIISSSINIDGRHILQQAGMEFNLRK